MTGTHTGLTRRQFGFSALAGVASMSAIGRVRAAGAVTPSDQITVGVVGLGSRGFNLIDDFLGEESCRIIALCDVDELHYRDLVWGKGRGFGRIPAQQHVSQAYARVKSGTPAEGIQVYSDFRELISQASPDVVVVATPDHWHAVCTMESLRAGKDVYCEKPVTHLFAEGRAIVDAVASQKAVFQTGSQQRSDPLFQKVVNLVRNGVLGDVHTVEVGLPPGYEKPMGDTAILTGRDGLDYDFWCGPAPKLPLMRARHHRWWRGHRAFGGGVLMDWIGHHNDIAHWAIGAERSGPTSIEVTEWSLPQTDVYNTPHHYTIACQYAGGIQSTISSRNQEGLKIMGTDGWIFVRRGQVKASNSKWLEDAFHPGTFRVPSVKSHVADFLECVRTRQECIAPAEIAHRSITPGHLGYVAAELGRKLQWNAATQVVSDDAAANQLLNQMAYRQPWTLSGEQDSA